MFYIVGLGLGDAKDITVKGLEIVRASSKVFLEAYTSILCVGKDELEKFYGREVILADRDLVEEGSDEILEDADKEDVTLLVVGDPFSATTHSDLVLRARTKGIPTKIIHNASIMNAVGCSGLQLYNFGKTVSIPFWTDSWRPDSFFDTICFNKRNGLHTLCLLDIKVKEQTPESMTKKKKEYLPPSFMSVAVAAGQLLEIARARPGAELGADTLTVGVARVGSPTERILVGSLEEMAGQDLGPPLHSLLIVGQLHPLEEQYLALYTPPELTTT